MKSESEEKLKEAKQLRLVVFVGVAISASATILGALLVPIFYNHIQFVQSAMQNELDFCKQRSANIWREVTKIEVTIYL